MTFEEITKDWSNSRKRQFIDKMKRFDLAVKINPDFLSEAMEDMIKEFPEFKPLLEN